MSWARDNRLRLNAGKTNAIITSRSGLAKDIRKVVLDGVTIEYESSARNLGLTFDEQLNWNQHARSVSSKIFAGLRCI